jgi:hypothetical protein
MTDPVFDCEAYGPDVAPLGVLCFFAGTGARACSSAAVCHQAMAAERERVFARIGELAAEDDPVSAFLAGEFTDPRQLLGGGMRDPGNPVARRAAQLAQQQRCQAWTQVPELGLVYCGEPADAVRRYACERGHVKERAICPGHAPAPGAVGCLDCLAEGHDTELKEQQ